MAFGASLFVGFPREGGDFVVEGGEVSGLNDHADGPGLVDG